VKPAFRAISCCRPHTLANGFGHNRRVCAGRAIFTAACSIALATVVLARTHDAKTAPPAVLVSRQLMARAHLSVGDVVTLAADPSATRAAQFRVAGVYEPTPDPMKFNVERLEARLHLDDLLSLTADPTDPASTESVASINVTLEDANAGNALSRALADRFPLLRTVAAAGPDAPTFVVIDRFHAAIAAVTVIGSTAFLLALMVIRAEERKDTIGILRLIGISRKSILSEVVVEALLVALAGAVFGVAVAVAAQRGVNLIFQTRYDTPLVFVRVTPSIALRAVAVAVPVGVVAGVVASWTLLRREATALVRR
jgi:FtsX-like permease family protein